MDCRQNTEFVQKYPCTCIIKALFRRDCKCKNVAFCAFDSKLYFGQFFMEQISYKELKKSKKGKFYTFFIEES